MFEQLLPNAAACYNKSDHTQQSSFATELGFVPDLESVESKHTTSIGMDHRVHLLNICGYCPLVSTVTGLFRALVGTAYLVKSVACYIFDSAKRPYHTEAIKIAAANIGRGLFETIPVIGNIFAANIDLSRMLHRWAEYSEEPYGYGTLLAPHRFNDLDALAFIPVVGTVVSLARSIFFAGHALVTVPPALTGNSAYIRAVKVGVQEVGYGLLGLTPMSAFLIFLIKA